MDATPSHWCSSMLLEGEAIVRDVERQRSLEREVLKIADYERDRLGRELHDRLCPSLAGIAALSSALSRTLAASAQWGPAAAADEIVRLLNETIGETRDLAHGLSSDGRYGSSLAEELERLARDVRRRYGVPCSFKWDCRCSPLHHDAETHLLRVAQEAISNAVAHGRADQIDIRVERFDQSGLLSIRDNGVGLSEDNRKRDGMGLHTMDYRARAIGGSLKIARSPGGGTMVACAFPLTRTQNLFEGPADGGRVANSTSPVGRSILIVDDHPILRRGLTALIESVPELAVRAAVGTRAAALEAIRESQPDLAIVDLSLGDEDGLDLIKDIKARYPKVSSLVLSMHDEEVYAERALSAGALGYVAKGALDETVLDAIRFALAGQTYMSEELQRRLAERYVGGRTLETDAIGTLSDRELRVFRLIGQGRTTRQIAVTLSRSVKTIESHLEHIKNKLALGSAAELAQRATQWVETRRPG
jgi:DNA-binding NarL/FixJ family response regulator/two-component sensor histidine kinase